MKTGKQPGQFKRLADSYRPLLAAILAILFALPALSQYDSTKKVVPQQSYGFSWKNGKFRNSLVIPAEGVLPTLAIADTGAVAYFQGNIHVWALRLGVLAWYETGTGSGGGCSIVGDSMLVCGADTLRTKPLKIETDLAPAYAFVDQDTVRFYFRQYAIDSVIIRKSGDTLFFPNGDSIYAAGINNTGFVNTSFQYFKGRKVIADTLQIGTYLTGNRPLRFYLFTNIFSPSEESSTYGSIRGRELTSNTGGLLISGWGGTNGYGSLTGPNLNIDQLTWSGSGVRVKMENSGLSVYDSANLIVEGTKAIRIPVGVTANRPTKLDTGYIRINTDSSGIEWYNGSAWRVLGSGGGSGTVTSGYGINGDGSGGDPLRVDSATLRGDYIRNQYAARESKRAWVDTVYGNVMRFDTLSTNSIPNQEIPIFINGRMVSSPVVQHNFVGLRVRQRTAAQGFTASDIGYSITDTSGSVRFSVRWDGRTTIGTGTSTNFIDVYGTTGGFNNTNIRVKTNSTSGDSRLIAENSGTGRVMLQATSPSASILANQGSLTVENLPKFEFMTDGQSASGGTSPFFWKAGGYSVTPQFSVFPSNRVGVNVGTTEPVASVAFQVNSTTAGFLPPRMTATQASAISSPAEGLLIYVTNTNGTFTAKGWWGYNGSAWEKLNN